MRDKFSVCDVGFGCSGSTSVTAELVYSHDLDAAVRQHRTDSNKHRAGGRVTVVAQATFVRQVQNGQRGALLND